MNVVLYHWYWFIGALIVCLSVLSLYLVAAQVFDQRIVKHFENPKRPSKRLPSQGGRS